MQCNAALVVAPVAVIGAGEGLGCGHHAVIVEHAEHVDVVRRRLLDAPAAVDLLELIGVGNCCPR